MPMARFAAGRDLDDALVPAVGLFDRLMNRQRVDEFVGDDDGGAARHIGEGGVPQHRHAEAFQPLLLHLLQLGADFDQMNDDAPHENRRRLSPRAKRRLINVPRPGPSSTTRTFSGEPICCHTATIHNPISSPNIWLISGAVTKSPWAPSGSRVT